MATPNPYFLYPFAIDSSSLLTIPNTGASTGAMSYEYGFTINYEQDLQTVSTALPIPRNQFNQLMLDVTSAIQQLQLYGVPNWVASGSGGPTSYPLNATVLYIDGNIYQSQVASNTSVPGADQNWLIISGQANSVPIGTIIDFAGTTAPNGYILCDGSAVSRTVTYAQLFDAIVTQQTCTTSNTSQNLTVVSSTQMYVGMPLEGAGIPSMTTVSSVTNSTTIVMSQAATASASVPVKFFSWGAGDGSTTFNLPSLAATVTAGQDGQNVDGITANTTAVGQSGGSATSTALIAHTHGISGGTEAVDFLATSSSSGTYIAASGSGTQFTATSPSTASAGSGSSFSIVQPTAIVYKCIKYI